MANPTITNYTDKDPLWLDEQPLGDTLTVAQDAGGVIPKGAVLGVITSGGKLKRAASASVDGSQIAKYIAAQAIDATGGDVTAYVIKKGVIREDGPVFTGSETLATAVGGVSYKDQLRDVGIFTRSTSQINGTDNQ